MAPQTRQRHALTLESDPTFVTGWGAGNIVSDPTYRRSAESLEARGFGSLKVRPLSLMPEGLEAALDKQAMADLLEFIQHPDVDALKAAVAAAAPAGP